MKYIVSLVVGTFEFTDAITAMSFAELAASHAVEDISVRIRLVPDEAVQDDVAEALGEGDE